MKFRVWSLTYKRYFTDDFLIDSDGYLFENERGELTQMKSAAWLAEFCTGFQDKNGKEIYEGDIIRIRTTDPFEKLQVLERVIFRDGSFCVLDGAPLSFYPFLEIKGNIHQNPELLEK